MKRRDLSQPPETVNLRNRTANVAHYLMLCDTLDSREVYILRCTETGRIKIGIANNAAKRIADIQRMSPTVFEVLAMVKSGGNNLETYLHRKYAEHRIHGEWFEPDDEMLKSLSKMLKTYWESCYVWFVGQGNRENNANSMTELLTTLPIKPFNSERRDILSAFVSMFEEKPQTEPESEQQQQ